MKTMMAMMTKWLNGFAKHWALFLGKKSEKLTRFNKKLCLSLFCLVFGGTSTSIILHALSRGRGDPPLQQSVHIPPHIGKPNAIRVKSYIPETVYKQVEAFKKYMDSLSRNDKKKYEEILGQRPGLPDSILLFEKLYLSQSKNKNGN
jgi:hypothetical protein